MGIVRDYIAYIRDNPKHYWFKRKLYGWGWDPATKEGWAVILVYVALVVAFALTIDESSPPREIVFTFILPVALLTVALLRICYKTGEPPKWQWGLEDKSLSSNPVGAARMADAESSKQAIGGQPKKK